jgi:hypothetical protein
MNEEKYNWWFEIPAPVLFLNAVAKSREFFDSHPEIHSLVWKGFRVPWGRILSLVRRKSSTKMQRMARLYLRDLSVYVSIYSL